ncbi:MAG: cytochrome C assembly family protein, partial [Stenotrophobium sp.]
PAGAIVLHALAISRQIFGHGGITIGTNEAVSLFAWQSALLLWAFCWKEPLRTLGLVIYPFAGFCAVWAALLPTPFSDIPFADWKARAHIVISLFTAGVLTVAAVQACALALQDQFLHRSQQGRFMAGLPPLQTMERLLFQLIGLGFFLLSLTLMSGFWFIRENLLVEHLVHKTVLSVTAWLIFGILLWGRWRYGWRGRTAIRWALSGYGFLILAYFGSKLVLEQILGEHWS